MLHTSHGVCVGNHVLTCAITGGCPPATVGGLSVMICFVVYSMAGFFGYIGFGNHTCGAYGHSVQLPASYRCVFGTLGVR